MTSRAKSPVGWFAMAVSFKVEPYQFVHDDHSDELAAAVAAAAPDPPGPQGEAAPQGLPDPFLQGGDPVTMKQTNKKKDASFKRNIFFGGGKLK